MVFQDTLSILWFTEVDIVRFKVDRSTWLILGKYSGMLNFIFIKILFKFEFFLGNCYLPNCKFEYFIPWETVFQHFISVLSKFFSTKAVEKGIEKGIEPTKCAQDSLYPHAGNRCGYHIENTAQMKNCHRHPALLRVILIYFK